jgi:hypothetical protein
MPEVKKFDEGYVVAELEKIGLNLEIKVKVYLIGGCSMVFRGLKEATKDVDVVLSSPDDLKEMVGVLKSLGYRDVLELPAEYRQLGASAILRNAEGFQVDLYYRQVCRGLEVTDRMEGRAEFFKSLGKLDVYLIAPEDIFLFKSITEREADLLDMRVLAESGIRWDTVKEECLLQEKRKAWEYFLVERLDELKEEYGIEAPITRELWKIAGDELVKRVFVAIIEDGNDTVDKIAKAVGERSKYSESWTRKELKKLVDRGIIKVDKKGKKYRYYLS